MLKPITWFFMAASAVSALLCIRFAFSKQSSAKSPIVLPSGGPSKAALEVDRKQRNKKIIFAFVSAIIFLILTIITSPTTIAAGDIDPSPSPTVANSSTPSPVISPSPIVSPLETAPSLAEAPSNRFSWLDELEPIYQKPGNFYYGGWADKTEFLIGDQTYSRGVGMCISGTTYETKVARENTPDQKNRWDCKEVSLDYRLDKKYESMLFSIGVDKNDPSLYGPKDTNGIAQVIITNADTGNELFNTYWEDFSYAMYEREIPLSSVTKLRITIRASGVTSRIHKSLRFVLANPILFLKDDSE